MSRLIPSRSPELEPPPIYAVLPAMYLTLNLRRNVTAGSLSGSSIIDSNGKCSTCGGEFLEYAAIASDARSIRDTSFVPSALREFAWAPVGPAVDGCGRMLSTNLFPEISGSKRPYRVDSDDQTSAEWIPVILTYSHLVDAILVHPHGPRWFLERNIRKINNEPARIAHDLDRRGNLGGKFDLDAYLILFRNSANVCNLSTSAKGTHGRSNHGLERLLHNVKRTSS